MAGRPLPTEQEVRSWIRERRNWGRWGKDDQRGAMNLVTPEKRVAAARLVKSGRSVSLSRPFPTSPGLNNSLPAQHYMRVIPRGKGAFAGVTRFIAPRWSSLPQRPQLRRSRIHERTSCSVGSGRSAMRSSRCRREKPPHN